MPNLTGKLILACLLPLSILLDKPAFGLPSTGSGLVKLTVPHTPAKQGDNVGGMLNSAVIDSFDRFSQEIMALTGINFNKDHGDTIRWLETPTSQPGTDELGWHKTGRAIDLNDKLKWVVIKDPKNDEMFFRIFLIHNPVQGSVSATEVKGDGGTPTVDGGGSVGFRPTAKHPLRTFTKDDLKNKIFHVNPYGIKVVDYSFVDVTAIAEANQWMRIKAHEGWPKTYKKREWWHYERRDGRTWLQALREIYSDEQVKEKAWRLINNSSKCKCDDRSKLCKSCLELIRRLSEQGGLLQDLSRMFLCTDNQSLKPRLNALQTQVAALNAKLLVIREQFQKFSAEPDKSFDGLKAEMKTLEDGGQCKIEKRRGAIYIAFPDAMLFDGDKSQLKDAARNALRKFAQSLQSSGLINSILTSGRRIVAVGHTDNRPSKSEISNWELSAKRSLSVVKFLTEDLRLTKDNTCESFQRDSKTKQLGYYKGCAVPFNAIGASAYSQFDPVAENATETGRAQNRRVEITIQPDIVRLLQIIEQYKTLQQRLEETLKSIETETGKPPQ